MTTVNDTTLDVDLAGPECDLQDDDFQMLNEDDGGGHECVTSTSAPLDSAVETSESDDDLDSIPNLFRNRSAMKAALKRGQNQMKERSTVTASGISRSLFGRPYYTNSIYPNCNKCY
jgi:hypothetical protein